MSEEADKIKAIAQSTEGPQPYEIWRHWKSRGLYAIDARAIDEATLTPVVIYRSLKDKVVWSRPLADFVAMVDAGERMVPRMVPRFTRFF